MNKSLSVYLDACCFCRLLDALHLAFAEASDATVFLTTDDRLLRKAISYAGDIKVRVSNPVTWLMENQEEI